MKSPEYIVKKNDPKNRRTFLKSFARLGLLGGIVSVGIALGRRNSDSASADSSPCSRRLLWIRSSKRFMEIWRKTVAKTDSSFWQIKARLSSSLSRRFSCELKTSNSAKTEAVSASGSGVSLL